MLIDLFIKIFIDLTPPTIKESISWKAKIQCVFYFRNDVMLKFSPKNHNL